MLKKQNLTHPKATLADDQTWYLILNLIAVNHPVEGWFDLIIVIIIIIIIIPLYSTKYHLVDELRAITLI